VRYFKITFGTGLTEKGFRANADCGHKDTHDKYFTKAQLKCARSMILQLAQFSTVAKRLKE
jgi:hypothetical protein